MNQYKFGLLFLALVCFSCFAETDESINQARTLFEKAAASPSVPGISVAVADNTGVIWAEGFGYADLENNVPMTKDIKLRIGSVAKVISAAGLMRLYEKGLLKLDADIRELVPEWPDKHPKITLKHLASHTSGIRHYRGNEFFSNIAYQSSVDGLDIFKNDKLNFNPGSRYGYSTYAWTLISAAMESAAKKDFKTIINNEVLSPLNMSNTTFDDNDILISNRQRPYSYLDGKLHNSREVNVSYKYAGGGFLSTPSDVVNFAMAHTHPDFLQDKTLKMMFQKTPLETDAYSQFGIGWAIGFEQRVKEAMLDESRNRDIIRIMKAHPNSVMHSGGSLGGTTMMILCLEHQHAVTVVKNVDREETANVFELALQAMDMLYSPG